MSEAKSFGLVVDPLDVLFFRDGRPFGPSTRAGGGLPSPQTLWGALTTALLTRRGCKFDVLRKAVRSRPDWADAVARACGDDQRWIAAIRLRGPWLARRQAANGRSAGAPELLFPTPATLHVPKKRSAAPPTALRPLPNTKMLPGWPSTSVHNLRPLWSTGDEPTQPARGFLTEDGSRAFLAENRLPAEALLPAEKLYQFDRRTGIAIDADRLTSAESQIYGASFLSLAPGMVFYAEALFPSEAPEQPLAGIDIVAWGGEGRRAMLEIVPARREPATLPPGKKPLLLLTTPGLFDDGWKPKCLDGLLVAAAVPERLPVSGWDLARDGPKPNRFAAPAGSVYFLNALPDHLPDNLSDGDLERRQGWGCYQQGAWTDA